MKYFDSHSQTGLNQQSNKQSSGSSGSLSEISEAVRQRRHRRRVDPEAADWISDEEVNLATKQNASYVIQMNQHNAPPCKMNIQ